MGLVSALVATVVVSVGVREVTDDRVVEHIRLRDIFPIGVQILRENRPFRNYTLVKVLVGAAEFAVPYYIIAGRRAGGRARRFCGHYDDGVPCVEGG